MLSHYILGKADPEIYRDGHGHMIFAGYNGDHPQLLRAYSYFDTQAGHEHAGEVRGGNGRSNCFPRINSIKVRTLCDSCHLTELWQTTRRAVSAPSCGRRYPSSKVSNKRVLGRQRPLDQEANRLVLDGLRRKRTSQTISSHISKATPPVLRSRSKGFPSTRSARKFVL